MRQVPGVGLERFRGGLIGCWFILHYQAQKTVFFSPFFKCVQGGYFQLNHSPWAPSAVKEGKGNFHFSPNRGGFVTHLYCCLESHLPAFVSRSLVARTLIILIKRIKFTWKREKQQQLITVKGDAVDVHIGQAVLPPRWVKGLVSELEVVLLGQEWAPLGKTQWMVRLHQPCLTRMVDREGNGILWEGVGIPNGNTDTWASQPGLPCAWVPYWNMLWDRERLKDSEEVVSRHLTSGYNLSIQGSDYQTFQGLDRSQLSVFFTSSLLLGLQLCTVIWAIFMAS